jgi:hypothetical protein
MTIFLRVLISLFDRIGPLFHNLKLEILFTICGERKVFVQGALKHIKDNDFVGNGNNPLNRTTTLFDRRGPSIFSLKMVLALRALEANQQISFRSPQNLSYLEITQKK